MLSKAKIEALAYMWHNKDRQNVYLVTWLKLILIAYAILVKVT